MEEHRNAIPDLTLTEVKKLRALLSISLKFQL